MLKAKKPRKKKCGACKQWFQPDRLFQSACCPFPCAQDIAREKREKKERKELMERKQGLKSRSQWKQDAQVNAFNPYIRLRDKDDPCISCGRYDHEISDTFRGGKWDCGHFLTVGGYEELRFHPDNAHKQCKSCNGGSGKYTKKDKTVSVQYRENLIKKIGIDRVEWLEGPHEAQHWTIEDFREIKQYYKEQRKLLMHNKK